MGSHVAKTEEGTSASIFLTWKRHLQESLGPCIKRTILEWILKNYVSMWEIWFIRLRIRIIGEPLGSKPSLNNLNQRGSIILYFVVMTRYEIPEQKSSGWELKSWIWDLMFFEESQTSKQTSDETLTRVFTSYLEDSWDSGHKSIILPPVVNKHNCFLPEKNPSSEEDQGQCHGVSMAQYTVPT